jgi:hypothetical protein
MTIKIAKGSSLSKGVIPNIFPVWVTNEKEGVAISNNPSPSATKVTSRNKLAEILANNK